MTKLNTPQPQGRPRRRLTLLFMLVAFVFAILLISVSASAVFVYVLQRLGFLQPLSENRLPMLLFFLLVISLFVGIITTFIAGNISLRPLRKLMDATKEIAAGNFSVRVEEYGPEEYRRLTNSFNEMARELGSIETLRDDFVSSISHEYKTPIASIRGFAKILKKGNLSQEQQQEYLDIIIAESDRLAQLSGNVLLLSKLSSVERPADMAAFSLDEQLRRVVLMLAGQIDKKQIELDIALETCSITSNQELLQQVWMNLLHNAIKFTPQGGRIDLRLICSPTQVRVEVQDTGIGIAPEMQPRIFEKFYQGDPSRSGEGNGLGLSLVKRIVELCGGSVEVQSQAGAGSLFTVLLPRS